MHRRLQVAVLAAVFVLALPALVLADGAWEKRLSKELTRLEAECSRLDKEAPGKGSLVQRAKALCDRISTLEKARELPPQPISLSAKDPLGSLTLALVKMDKRLTKLVEGEEGTTEKPEPEPAATAPETTANGLEPAEEKRRLRRLRTRAQAYLKERKAVVVRCRKCNGAGHHVRIRPGTGGRDARTETCQACAGYGRRISHDSYLQLHYHLKSPAYRTQRGGVEQIRWQIDRLQQAGPPPRVTRTVLKEVALHGSSHGVAWVKVNREKEYTAVPWIWVEDVGGIQGEWYLYEASADGAWPDLTASTAEADPEEPAAAEQPTPLEPEDLEHLNEAVGALALAHQLKSAKRIGGKLFLAYASAGIPPNELQTRAADDVTRVARAIWGKGLAWESIHWTLSATWRNDFGKTEVRPYLTASIAKPVFDRIVWVNLSAGEAFRLFRPEYKVYEGFRIYQ